jgi:flavorubredoxin
MAVREIKNSVYSVGAIDWDRRLFDELISLPDGTTYNSYLIKGNERFFVESFILQPNPYGLPFYSARFRL